MDQTNKNAPTDRGQGGFSDSAAHALSEELSERSTAANFILVALYQIIVRIGWIFKTESIIMPAVLDVLGGAGWLRGMLPMLNRFGQSIPPMLASDRIRRMPRKKYLLAGCAATMGLCFLVLSAVWGWTRGEGGIPLAMVFLAVYGLFFVSVGIHNLTAGVLDGKLIPVQVRGRLMLFSMTLGATGAVTCAWFLLRIWLSSERPRFGTIFLFTGIAFVIAAAVATLFRESLDESDDSIQLSARELGRGAWKALRGDGNFRCLAIVASLFGMALTLFPHYQALARGRLELPLSALVPWVIAQNIGAAGFSIPLGWLADRFGNRLVLRIEMAALAIAPVLAVGLAWIEANYYWFMLVFLLLGLTPVTMRTFNNYTLEIVGRRHHARYLSTLSLCMAGPTIATSFLVGALVDWMGFETAFGIVVVLVLVGWGLTWRLEEPRSRDAAS